MTLNVSIQEGDNSLGVLCNNLRFQAQRRGVLLVEPPAGVFDLIVGTTEFVSTAFALGRVGPTTIVYTMLESSAVPMTMLPVLNVCRMVVVPCHANAISMSAMMPEANVKVCPYGFNPTEIVRTQDRPYEDSVVVFGSVFDWKSASGDRKNIAAMVAAFDHAFLPDRYKGKVKLVLCTPDAPEFLLDDPKSKVEIIAGWKNRENVMQIIHGFDCGVYVPAYEGYGIAALETLASQKPLVTHALSGHADFVPQSECFIVDCTLTRARAAYSGLGHWYKPDHQSMINAFHSAFKLGKTLGSIKGVTAAKRVAHLTWDRAFDRLLSYF